MTPLGGFVRVRLNARKVGVALAATALAGLSILGGSVASAAPQAHTPPATADHARPSLPKPATAEQAKSTKTQLVATKPDGSPANTQATPNVGNNSAVDFYATYNYCQQGLTYTYVKNNTASTQYYEVVFYDGSGSTRTLYSSIAANSYGYPAFSGVNGTWYAYLYVWNGSSYAYDEYRTGSNTCNVSISLTTNTGYTGYVLLTIKNNGTDYAYIDSNELAPYSGYGTYTGGEHWDYPSPNGGIIYRYYYVGTGLHYGIYANVYGSNYTPWFWYGQL